jgi:5'-nucleotidase
VAKKKYSVMLVNDDSVHATGINILFKELSRSFDVTIVAPLEEMSTTGHFLTLHKPLRVFKLGEKKFGVSGGPADCVNLGLNKVMSRTPDFVVSGINRGANLGQDIFYSGTVSAAREACFHGIPGIGVSLAIESKNYHKKEFTLHFEAAAKLVVRLMKKIKPQMFLPNTYMNINIPNLPFSKIRGVEFANQGFQIYSKSVIVRADMRGRNYFWIGGIYKGFRADKKTDCYKVYKEKKASITIHSTQTECTQSREIFSSLTKII